MPTLAKLALRGGTNPLTYLSLRASVTACLLIIVRRLGGRKVAASPLGIWAVALGATLYTGQTLAFFYGLEHGDASLMTLLLYSYPILTLAAAPALLREPLGLRSGATL